MASQKSSTLPIRKLTLPSGTEVYRVHIRRQGHTISRNFKLKTHAKEFCEIELGKLNQLSANRSAIVDKQSVVEVIEGYLADPEVQELKGYKDRKCYLLALRPYVRHLMAHETTRRDIKRVLKQYAAEFEKKHKRTIAGATLNRVKSYLSSLFKWADEAELVDGNPVTGVAQRKENKRRERTYTDAEWSQLLEAADDLPDTDTHPTRQYLPMFLGLSWETGARCGELLNLRWVDVTWLDDAHPMGAELAFLDTKNGQNREVFISKATAALLRAHYQQFGSSRVFAPVRGGEKVRIHRPFRVAREQAGLDAPDEKWGETLTLHHIRHTWATRLADTGASLAQLMRAGGWSSPAMATRYMKTQKSQALEAAILLMGK